MKSVSLSVCHKVPCSTPLDEVSWAPIPDEAYGEKKAKISCILMFVYGSDPDRLTASELAEVRRKLAKMSGTALRDYYFARWRMCELTDGKPPKAAFIQELVQVWKELWNTRHR